jgi:Skp family chaperone for outer membrane proteins
MFGVMTVMIGCGQRQSALPPSPSLVVDLDAVAKAMGRDAEIARKVEQATESLNMQLVQAAQEMDKQLQKQKADLGASPSPTDREKYRQAELRVQQQILNNRAIAEQARQTVRNEQILLFRKEVRPIAARMAQRRNATVVTIANQDVVWFDPSADLTAEVIAEMRAQASSVSMSKALPHAEANFQEKTNAAEEAK